MRARRPMIGLSLFMVVAIALTWMVYVTLQREVAGAVGEPQAAGRQHLAQRALDRLDDAHRRLATGVTTFGHRPRSRTPSSSNPTWCASS